MKESEIQKVIIEYLKYRGVYVERLNSGQAQKGDYVIKLCEKGTPDIHFCINGRALYAEIKRSEKEYCNWKKHWKNYQETGIKNGSNKRSVHQHKKMQEISKSGGVYLCVWSLDGLLEDLETLNIKL